MANSFSLIRLPRKARLHVLQCMDGRALILLSLISQKSKEMVKSLQLRNPDSSDIWISIGRHISIEMYELDATLSFYKDPEQNMQMLKKPVNMWISDEEDNSEIKFLNSMEFKEWLEHLSYILNRDDVELSFEHGSEVFNFQAIKETFGKISAHNLFTRAAQSREILTSFLPNINRLFLFVNPFPPRDNRFQKLLIQNFACLELGVDQFENMTLNDLLICNSTIISHQAIRKFVGLNRFIKLWMKGVCPRLQRLTIVQPTSITEDIFKGVSVLRKIPPEEVITIENSDYDLPGVWPDRIAADIQRFDGIQATAVITKKVFCFFVRN